MPGTVFFVLSSVRARCKGWYSESQPAEHGTEEADKRMDEILSMDRARQLVVQLRGLVSDRAAEEATLAADLAAKKQAAARQHEEAQKEAAARYQRDKAQTEAEYLALRSEVVARFQSDQSAAKDQYDVARSQILAQMDLEESAAGQHLQEAQWQATAVFEAAHRALAARLKEAQSRLAEWEEKLRALHQEAEQALLEWGRGGIPVSLPQPDPAPQGPPLQRLAALVSLAEEQVRRLKGYKKPGFWQSAFGRLRKQESAGHDPAAAIVRQTLQAASLAWRETWEALQAEWQRQSEAATAQLGAEMKQAAEAHARRIAELKSQRLEAIRQAEASLAAARSAITARHNHQRHELEQRYATRLQQIEDRYAAESSDLRRRYERTIADWEEQFQRRWEAMRIKWLQGVEQVAAGAAEMNACCHRVFLDWNAPEPTPWTPAAAIPPAVPFGRLEWNLRDLEGGMPQDPRLVPPHERFALPALFAFRDQSLLLWNVRGEGRARAIEAIQSLMLRMLTAMPPGKVRFLILDPVGLGENFAAFMHLADYNESLIWNRIWTEPSHIERRLGELTEHMENVLQVYLRNEFATLHQFNQSAGELAEPYRILIVANFPANFSETAARRLSSIVANGARCGVYTLLSRDTTLTLPREFQPADLERHAIRLHWTGERFVWEDPDFESLRLLVERPPAPERFTELVRAVGREAQDAGRIELPFESVAPEAPNWWTAHSAAGVEVPLGRAGVTKLQYLRLGPGTSQHVLIAGKTGSGKSTLLHVLIVNLALRYSPEEVELYLVDFKKGVEFKAYAEAGLPHARIIAIESEREFGLSVLERLDLELRQRGDLFRQRGVQDLRGFRAMEPDARMPRILLIIDEFQELFVEDDRIAQSAALLLDRLVRQGRAFGIHVVLGSQTLAGAYSIPRSTIGQMAVRIALQCSEADAHLILSEENTAARLLSRPGEAIYNDANGLYEGNHPFQVVWLSDQQREQLLERIRQWAGDRIRSYPAAIVFEGNLPAELSQNLHLRELLQSPAWSRPCATAKAWIGSPVAIREPTAALFARQAGSNLLVVGHHEETACGILAASMVSLAAQHAPVTRSGFPGARFYVLDGMRPDAPCTGLWRGLASALPHELTIVSPRGAAAVLAEIAKELARREQVGGESDPPIFLIVYDLSRFRELRRAESDFGFGRDEGPPTPARQLRDILHDGPMSGIHCLLWCDSYHALTRSLDRQALDDIEMLVVFRMNPGDSSSLIDSPAASFLGVYRAIFYDKGQGLSEKFRPYGPPTPDWLDWVREQLQRSACALTRG